MHAGIQISSCVGSLSTLPPDRALRDVTDVLTTSTVYSSWLLCGCEGTNRVSVWDEHAVVSAYNATITDSEERTSLAEVLEQATRGRANVKVLSRATVTRVLFHETMAIGVSVEYSSAGSACMHLDMAYNDASRFGGVARCVHARG
jgi:hypothetical protein